MDESQSLCVAGIVEAAKTEPAIYDRDKIVDALCDAGFSEELAEALTDALRNCFVSQRYSTHFDVVALKRNLVRARMTAATAESFLSALAASIATPLTAEIRHPIQHQPSPGRVVMCDFTFLKKPEMQKERRAVIVSARSANATGRCAIVPVSMLESIEANPLHLGIVPGTYPFFHKTEAVWVVCDHIYTVSLERIWMVNVNRRPMPTAMISPQHLAAVRNLLGTALGIGVLTTESDRA